ncbi:MAG TPA: hypothetical protein VLA88_04610 [Candidatus Saccharimonadales bacterium]|nr:hypothetical protein [Candidatus Saccharimonadales bacterium]
MEEVTKEQLAKMAPRFLRERENRIADGTATWDDYHQAGVGWSELAESAWWLRMEGWWRAAALFGQFAVERFDEALARVPAGSLVPALAIRTDRAMALVRGNRQSDTHLPWTALNELDDIISGLTVTLTGAPGDLRAAAIHQLAITHGFKSRLCWGSALGFRKSVAHARAVQSSADALEYFDLEAMNSPDRETAYRTHLIMQALAQSRHGNANARRQLCKLAIRSAQTNGDARHQYRGCLVYLMGGLGEKLLRKRRDTSVVLAAL